MIKKFLQKWLLRGTKEEIENFVDEFAFGNTLQLNGSVVAKVALMHYCLKKTSPEFEKLVNSKKGENISEITSFTIFQLDRLQKKSLKIGNIGKAAIIKFWSTTFRCMINDSFHNYGIELWEIASENFDNAEEYLNERLKTAITEGNKSEEEIIKGGISLCRFVPPQFISSAKKG